VTYFNAKPFEESRLGTYSCQRAHEPAISCSPYKPHSDIAGVQTDDSNTLYNIAVASTVDIKLRIIEYLRDTTGSNRAEVMLVSEN
jgi:hypothetical protein